MFQPDEERLSKLFKTLDTHNDGFITFEELKTYLSKSGQRFTKDEIKSLIKRGDVRSNDGVLDYKEFIDLMVSHEKEMWEHFVKLDKDGSGQISHSELSFFFKKQECNMPDSKIKELITRIDKDKNLLISWDEFREFNQFRSKFKITAKHYFGDPYADGLVTIPAQKGAEKKKFSFMEKLVCGGVAGVVSRTATAPLDRVKVLLQVQGNQKILGATEELSIGQLFKAMTKEGYTTMWRGNGISCVKIFPENALRFLIFELLCNSEKLKVSKYDLVNKLLCGGLTGIACQSLMYPVELTKTRVMTSQGSVGILGTVREISHENGKRFGVTNFYKGIAPALMGVLPFAALQLGLSKAGTELYSEWNQVGNPGFWPLLSISSSATLIAMGTTYPLQLTKCQMQAYRGPESARPTLRTLFSKIWSENGAKGFYRGFSANALKAIPASSIGWATFTKTQKLYEQYLG